MELSVEKNHLEVFVLWEGMQILSDPQAFVLSVHYYYYRPSLQSVRYTTRILALGDVIKMF